VLGRETLLGERAPRARAWRRAHRRGSARHAEDAPDGTLWLGSLPHGLARARTISHVAIPGPAGVSAVACDPSDGSVWIGRATGGILRLRDGAFETVDGAGGPDFASHPVQSIQIDRWSSPRVVYFAFTATRDAAGVVVASGGVGAYDGP
jgi:ligand-binding sensor domain-containing protein